MRNHFRFCRIFYSIFRHFNSFGSFFLHLQNLFEGLGKKPIFLESSHYVIDSSLGLFLRVLLGFILFFVYDHTHIYIYIHMYTYRCPSILLVLLFFFSVLPCSLLSFCSYVYCSNKLGSTPITRTYNYQEIVTNITYFL